MRIAIVGQQDFGKAVLEAFLARGDEVAGVFCAPEKPGAKADALKTAAQEKGVQVFQFASLKSEEAKAESRASPPPPADRAGELEPGQARSLRIEGAVRRPAVRSTGHRDRRRHP